MRFIDWCRKYSFWFGVGVAFGALEGCQWIGGLEERTFVEETSTQDSSSSQSADELECGEFSAWPDSNTPICSDGADISEDCGAAEQDGSSVDPVPLYTRSGKYVRDELTGLVWIDESSDPVTLLDAQAYCEGIQGRLPSSIELESLLDYGKLEGPLLNDTVFLSAISNGYWASDGTYTQVVNFDTGEVSAPDGLEHRALCVTCSTYLKPDFQSLVSESGNSIVTSNFGLDWIGQESSEADTWLAALEACEDAGSGWRLPTIKELFTLVDLGSDFSSINAEFEASYENPEDEPTPHWSSTPSAKYGSTSWHINFNTAETLRFSTSSQLNYRCVRKTLE